MRRLGTGLATLALSAVVGIVIVTGCSASGSGDDIGDASAATQPTDTASLPPPGATGGDTPPPPPPPPKDAGKDVQKDAGPPPPTPGTPCTEPNKIVSKACGACGTQSTVCLANPDAGADAGTGTWTDYSPCEGELAGGCVPGTMTTQACGNCGTQTMTCSNYCAWSMGACTGQPAMSCVPLSLDFATAGCTTASTYRQRSCKSDCTWDNFSTTCSAPPAIIQVPPTIGQQSSTIVTLSATKQTGRMKDDTPCPNAPVGTMLTAYEYVQVHNPNAKAALVTIFNSVVNAGDPAIHTELAAYAGATPPSTTAQRQACTNGVNTFGDDTISGDSNLATLSATDRPTVPPGGTITIYNAGYDNTVVGSVKLTVQLDDLK